MRIGHGYDAHKFGGHRPLVLGGVKIEHPIGLLAHSDGDVVLHAICDALLGSIAEGDIGRHFSDQDSAYKNIDSRELLRRVYLMVETAGYRICNLDVTIVAQTPRVNHVVDTMCEIIAEDLQTSTWQVNVKATTTEKMGFVGRKEGIACHAVVLLEPQQK